MSHFLFIIIIEEGEYIYILHIMITSTSYKSYKIFNKFWIVSNLGVSCKYNEYLTNLSNGDAYRESL